MATVTPTKRITPDDLLEMTDGDFFELVDGQIVERPMSAGSARVGSRFNFYLTGFGDEHKAGSTFDQTLGVRIWDHAPEMTRKADCLFIVEGKQPPDSARFLFTAPDIVVEALSPNDLGEEVRDKVALWLQGGVPLVWVAWPKTREIHVYRRGGRPRILGPDDELTGEDILPGFSVPVANLFDAPRIG